MKRIAPKHNRWSIDHVCGWDPSRFSGWCQERCAIFHPVSRRVQSTQPESHPPLGAWLRQLRQARKLPLRIVAAEAEMDSTLLSKIALGQRVPTEPQATALAAFFAVPVEEVQAKRIADKFWNEHNESPVTKRAALLIIEKAVGAVPHG